MDTVIIQKDLIRLNSGLDEYSFSKAKYFQLIQKEGYLFDGEKLSPWYFDGVNNFKDDKDDDKEKESVELVNYCGKNPLSPSAKTLLQFFNQQNEDDLTDDKSAALYSAVKLTVKAMTNAAENNINLPIVGAGGIIADISSNKVLFLPQDSFRLSTNMLSDRDNFRQNLGWINTTIDGSAAICFERAVIVYKFLTKCFPYPLLDENLRNQDVMDKCFCPLAKCIDGINLDFAKAINHDLRLCYKINPKKDNSKQLSKIDLTPGFDFDLFDEAWEYTKAQNISKEDMDTKSDAYLRVQRAKIATQKKSKSVYAIFIVVFIAAALLLYFVFGKSDNNNAQYTSKGLTASETVQGFFYGINTLSTDLTSSLSEGSKPKTCTEKLEEISILDKQIAGFTKQQTYYGPAPWLFIISDEESYNSVRAYGTTNLVIDGVPSDNDIEIHRVNQQPTPVTTENNKTLSEGDKVTKDVGYYFVQTNPENYEIVVQKQNDKYTLTYRDEMWVITDITSQQELIPVNTAEFKSDYFKALEDNNKDPVAATASLKEKYDWLPTNEAMLTQQSYLMY